MADRRLVWGAVTATVLVLTGCGKSADDAALGGKVTAAESQALHEAADMIEKGRPAPGSSAAPEAATETSQARPR